VRRKGDGKCILAKWWNKRGKGEGAGICIWYNGNLEEVGRKGAGICILYNGRIEEVRERVLVYVFSIMVNGRGEEKGCW
jgi:hypothetical protein